MTNFVAKTHGAKDVKPLLPSAHLGVEMTSTQQALLNPTPKDVQLGSLIDQVYGNRAKKTEAKRRIAFIDGNINSYSRILAAGDGERLQQTLCLDWTV